VRCGVWVAYGPGIALAVYVAVLYLSVFHTSFFLWFLLYLFRRYCSKLWGKCLGIIQEIVKKGKKAYHTAGDRGGGNFTVNHL